MQWPARQEFDRWAGRQQSWGAGLMVISAALFLWLGYLLLVPFTVQDGVFDEVACEAPLFHDSADTTDDKDTPYSEDVHRLCAVERDWPELLGIGILAVPPAVAGAALFTSGSARKRASAHVFRVLEMQESDERRALQQARPKP
ncbi:hypothetical protein ABT001_18450 [Streptomyces sp. NPDC002793]|uniref:hypothetical protein n=1 Tax=Streptomyces sp. NPDC002793 TaxID=3154432 RepID=UPI0033169B47